MPKGRRRARAARASETSAKAAASGLPGRAPRPPGIVSPQASRASSAQQAASESSTASLRTKAASGLDHLRIEHRRLRAARAAGEIVHPGEHMAAREGLLIAQGRGQIAHVPRAQLRQGALGLMGHKAAHGGDMVIGDAHEARKLKPALAKDGTHGQSVLLEDGGVLRAVGRFHRLAGHFTRTDEQARVLVAGLLGQHRAIDALAEVLQKAPEALHGGVVAGVLLHHVTRGLRQHACHHGRIRRTAEQLVEQHVQVGARQEPAPPGRWTRDAC